MEAKDRRFAEIAVRLQLLTQEQVATCVQYIRGKSGKPLSSAAVDLGFLSSDQAERVLGYEARLVERQREHQRKVQHAAAEEVAPRGDARAPAVAGLVEERAQKSDPRSASAPPRRAPAGPRRSVRPAPPSQALVERPEPAKAPPKRATMTAEAPARSPSSARQPRARPPSDPQPQPAPERKAQRGWEAPARREDGQVMVPQTSAERPARPRHHNAPTEKISEQAIHSPTLRELDPPAARSTQDLRATLAPPPPAAPAQPAAPIASVAADAGWFDLRDVSRPVNPRPQQLQGKDAGPPLAQPDFNDGQRSGSAQNVPAHGQAFHANAHAPRSRQAADVGMGVVTPGGSRAATLASPSSYLGRALALAIKQGGSDLHAHSGAPILVRIDGVLRPLSGNEPLNATAAEKVIAEVMGEHQKATLDAKGEVDFACEVPGLARMRVNVYRQQRGTDAVFRLVPRDAPTFEQLGLPARLGRLTDFRTGMVLCTGPAGSGKSTTLSALVSGLVQSRADHILTIEDPVEFVYPPGKALVNQRQLRDHTTSFARALRAALREDPDVIVITELRDRDTISLAISAAETGHLVLGTLTTGNASQTIGRIVSSFSSEEQEQMRVMLAESLRAVVSQRLVPKAKGPGRVPAIELLMVNTAVSNLIRDDKTHQLPSVMQTGKAAGMVTLDDSLDELMRAGTITAESARRYAVRKERFGG